jgi:hypothetical protein
MDMANAGAGGQGGAAPAGGEAVRGSQATVQGGGRHVNYEGAVSEHGGAQWTPEKQAAHAEMLKARSEMFNPDGSENFEAKVKFKRCADFVYGGGEYPRHMRPATDYGDPDAPANDPQSEFSTVFARDALAYQPAERAEEYHLEGFSEAASVADMQAARGVLHTLGLSKSDGETVWREIVRLGNGPPLTDADRAEGAQNLAAILKSAWGDQFDENLKSVDRAWERLPQATRDKLEVELGAAVYSPWAWHALARAGRVGK